MVNVVINHFVCDDRLALVGAEPRLWGYVEGSGGGGGGLFGGGGGSWNGGGGGSSYAKATATGVVHTQGYQTGNGVVIISY